MPKFLLPTPLRPYAGGAATVEVAGRTVARVLAVGTGGLGSPLSLYLAAAGVGTLGLVDYDVVDDSNLQRQILFGGADVGRPKLDAAEERLRGVNPNVRIEKFEERLTSENA